MPEKRELRDAGDLFRQGSPVVDADELVIEQRFGRPKGATNIATRQRAQLYMQIAGDPVLAMARLAAVDIETLRRAMGCTTKEAYEFQQKVRNDALPYVAQRLPLAVAISGKVTNLNIGIQASVGDQVVLGADAIERLFELGRTEAEKDGFVLPAPVLDVDHETVEETEA